MSSVVSSRAFAFACLAHVLGACGSPASVHLADVPTEPGPERSGEVKLATDAREEIEVLPAADTLDLAAEASGPQCEAGQGCFLDPCTQNADCQSGWCVQHLGEKVCSILCQEECPLGWNCQQVAGSAPDVVYVCVSLHANLCRPCAQNSDCTSIGGAADACISYQAAGSFCGGSCGAKDACPWGFSCQQVQSVEGASLKQCVNDTGDCPCTASSVVLGLATPCSIENEHGKCTGKRLCQEGGLSACDSPVPAAETCNGQDDDCDGDVDEPDLVRGDFVNLCEDGNDCTQDKCSGQEGCVNDTLASGTCSDDNPCTVADHCVLGECVGDPVKCDDENPCTDNLCTDDGGCEYPPNDADCDDGNPCTVADSCKEGVCGGVAVPCDCTSDPDCEPLEDGDLCNGTLVCDTTQLPYKCVVDAASVVTCEPPQGPEAFCLAAACDPATGDCLLAPDHEGQLCDNGDACTYNSKCSQGTCTSGTPVNCNDGNPCTDDLCDPLSGCVHQDNQSPCQDSDECTVGGQCSGGICLAGPSLSCDDGNVCTVDSCVPGGLCVHKPADGGCDDGNACTVNDACKEGICTGGSALECGDDNPCTDTACDPLKGCVTSVNEVPCDDGSVCTVFDHCHLGTCISSGQLVCDDGNPCTDDSCGKLVGCQFVPNQAPCDDKNPCTLADHCAGGWCLADGAEPCDDQNGCTKDTCLPEKGCQHAPLTGPCDDGNACTLGDSCVGGVCKPSETLACDDGNPCTDDSCSAQAGCLHSPNAALCTDGDVCTDGDSCVEGQCVPGPALDCDDGKECTVDTCAAPAGCKSTTLPDYSPCGPDGSWICLGDTCVDCQPVCAGKQCGPDGCGGVCGTCSGPGAACVGGLCQSNEPVLYFTDVSKSSISRVNLDGTGLATLISGGIDADDLELTASKMYWPDNDTSIRSANLDGSGILSVLTGKPSPYGIALDVAGGKIYWTNQTGNPKIQRSNMDGSSVETVLPGSGCCTSGIALDGAGGRLYWADGYYSGSISRCNLDGSNVQLLATTAGIPTGVALDPAGGKVYWTECGNGNFDFVKSANLDGSGAKTLLSGANGLQTPQHIVIHSAAGKMYFTDLHAGKVYQANLDGTGLKVIVANLGYPRGIALH